jgi:hypothetical protein
MKRIFKVLAFITFFTFIFLKFPSNKVYASEEFLDQYYLGQCCNVYTLSSESKVPVYQFFVPTVDYITTVSIEFSSYVTAGSSYTINIVGEENELLTSATNASAKAGWSNFVFSPAAEVTAGEIYKIQFSETTSLSILYNTVDDYLGGYGIFAGKNFSGSRDIHFKIFGYNSDGSKPDSGPTDLEIERPGSVLATDTSNNSTSSVGIEWEATETTDIDGYKIYRSDVEPEIYVPITEVDDDTLTYSDTDVEPETVYFYAVTAYKGNSESDKESDSTYTASITSSDTSAATDSTDSQSKKDSFFAMPGLLFYAAGGAILVIGGVVIFLVLVRKKKSETVSNNQSLP